MGTSIRIDNTKQIQKRLKSRVKIEKIDKKIEIVAGVDAAYSKFLAVAGIVAMSFPDLKIVEETFFVSKKFLPYISGYLAFREAPLVIGAIKKLRCNVDVFMLNGHGIAHPERIGLASHTGVLINKPTIGCAKSILTGNFSQPAREKSSYEFIYENSEIIGAIVRTKTDVKPVFVSIGNKITLEEAIEIVLHCCDDYRIPEPLRLAHIYAKEILKEKLMEAKNGKD